MTDTLCETCGGLGDDFDGNPCPDCGIWTAADLVKADLGPPKPPPPTVEPGRNGQPSSDTRVSETLTGALAVRKASEVTPTVVRWLWDGRIAYAKLNVLGGPPGVGKSYLTTAIAAAVSNGDGLPGDPRDHARPRRSLLLSYEDDPEDTLRPRLDKLNANLDLVELVEGVHTDGERRRAFGPHDVTLLAAHAEQAGDVDLVIVDPVSAFVGAGTDEHRANEVRAALEDLRIQAQAHRFAVLLVMHTRKSTADTALNRLSGSQAYGALVRSALMAGPVPDDDRRYALAHVKHNLAAKQPTLAYSVDGDGVWWHGEIDLDPEEVAGHSDGTERGARDEAEAFIADLLADGPVPSRDVLRQAEDVGIAERTLKRAKKSLGVRSERCDGAWSWVLPNPPRVPTVPRATPGTLGTLDPDTVTQSDGGAS